MSAYAVPGYLFPPLPSSFEPIGPSKVSIVDRPSSFVEKIGTFSDRSRSSEQPLHSAGASHGIQITVQDTKIDAVQLIQSFLSFSSSPKGESSSRPTPQSRHRRNRSSWNHNVASSNVDPSHSAVNSNNTVSKPLHEEEGYMMFTLRMVLGSIEDRPECDVANVSKSPRTITRTLAQIRQLYSDIVMEQTVDDECGAESHHPQYPIPDIPPPLSNMNGGAQEYHHLPSFTYLQEQIRSYVPVLNHWFHQLVQKVPLMRSSVFMKFTPQDDDMPVYACPSIRPRIGGKPKGRLARRIDSMESIDEGRCEEDEMD